MHICISWSNTDGKIKVFTDGTAIHEAIVSKKTIPGDGSLVLFQVHIYKSIYNLYDVNYW